MKKLNNILEEEERDLHPLRRQLEREKMKPNEPVRKHLDKK